MVQVIEFVLLKEEKEDIFYPFGKPQKIEPIWQITDDTQLTLATIEAMIEDEKVKPETVANQFLQLCPSPLSPQSLHRKTKNRATIINDYCPNIK